MMITFNWYPFLDLTVEQLYAILTLRAEIFVVEQHCPYLDPDGKDKLAMHLLGVQEDNLVAYLRVFPPTDIQQYIVFGRIVTARAARTKGHGKKLMREMLHYCDTHFPHVSIKCSAQYYLKQFYESFGFKAQGEIYQEDGLPHIAMERA